jgi:hypothetical protein
MTSQAVHRDLDAADGARERAFLASQLLSGTEWLFIRLEAADLDEWLSFPGLTCAGTGLVVVDLPSGPEPTTELRADVVRELKRAMAVFSRLPPREHGRFTRGLSAELSQADALGTAEFLGDYLEAWEETVDLHQNPRYLQGLHKVMHAQASANKGLKVEWAGVIDAISW